MKPFVIKVIVLTLLLALTGGLLFMYVFPSHYSPVFPYLLLFFFLFTLISHYFQFSRIKASFSSFARAHMVITIVRLFVFSAVIILYLILTRNNIVSFLVVTGVLYIAFTLLETRELTRLTGRRRSDGK
jgi:hypothetical protein